MNPSQTYARPYPEGLRIFFASAALLVVGVTQGLQPLPRALRRTKNLSQRGAGICLRWVLYEESCEGDETVVAVPPVAAVVEVCVAPLGVVVEDNDVAAAVRIAPILYNAPSIPLPVEGLTSDLGAVSYSASLMP